MSKEVFSYLLKVYGRSVGVWFGFACSIVSSIIISALVVIPIAKVASSLSSGDFDEARRQAILYFILSIIGSTIRYTGKQASAYYESIVYRDEMIKFYKALTTQDMKFYLSNKTGYLVASFRQFIDGGTELIRIIRNPVIYAIVSITTANIIIYSRSVELGLIVSALIVVQFLYIRWSSKLVLTYRKISHELYRKVTGSVSDDVTNIVALRSSGELEDHTSDVIEMSYESNRIFWERYRKTNNLDFPRAFLTYAGITITVLVLIGRGETSPQSVELIVLLITYLFSINRNVYLLPELIQDIDDKLTKIEPNLFVLQQEQEIVDADSAKPIKIKGGEIEFSQVSFNYTTSTDKTVSVFKDLSLKVSKNETVGIVGISGAGKSSLVNLIMRFDDIDSGSIQIDGQDIRDVTQESLRKQIAYVPQEPLLFHKSIKENIAYFNPKASSKDIEKAAKAAHAHEFIKDLPDGYDSIVGERGMKLSGGQKQRIVIARSILKSAPIMIFDEATSALDSESEEIIQKALPKIIGNHTAIIIAHRLSTVANLDRIIVLDKGKIIEQGTHLQLLKKDGRYAQLWAKQTKN